MRPYSVRFPDAENTVAAAVDLIAITAPATMALVVTRAWVGQSAGVTSEQNQVILQRASTNNATGATALTPRPLSVGDPAASFTAKAGPSADNTLTGDPLIDEGFNWVSGYLAVLAPEERIWVPPSGFLVLRLNAAPSAAKTVRAGLIVAEVG